MTPQQLEQHIIDNILPNKKEIELSEPRLLQYENRGSAPFYCTLCQMSELEIMENKEDEKYFCRCSYWSDPHNAFLDKSGGKWLGWKDKNEALRIVKDYESYDNGFNHCLIDVKSLLPKIIEYILKNKE